MKKVIIFGGSGFIGSSLAHHLQSFGYEPIIISRSPSKSTSSFDFHSWDAQTLGDWKNELIGAEAIINLTGKSVNCIKSPENIDEILRSRVDSTHLIGRALIETKNAPKIWIQMSTAHIYGDSETHFCTENSSEGYGLAPFVGRAWETAFQQSLPEQCRGVVLRTSFVIGKNGGALSSLKSITQKGLGGTVGSGKQGMSWIHEWDMNEIIRYSIENKEYEGIINCTAPYPVSNQMFMRELRSALKIPIGLPAPEFMVKFGAKYVLKTDPELALYGRYILPEKLQELGFRFKFPTLQDALKNLI